MKEATGLMKGRDRFTTAEAAEIRSILRAKTRADRSGQKACLASNRLTIEIHRGVHK